MRATAYEVELWATVARAAIDDATLPPSIRFAFRGGTFWGVLFQGQPTRYAARRGAAVEVVPDQQIADHPGGQQGVLGAVLGLRSAAPRIWIARSVALDRRPFVIAHECAHIALVDHAGDQHHELACDVWAHAFLGTFTRLSAGTES